MEKKICLVHWRWWQGRKAMSSSLLLYLPNWQQLVSLLNTKMNRVEIKRVRGEYLYDLLEMGVGSEGRLQQVVSCSAGDETKELGLEWVSGQMKFYT